MKFDLEGFYAELDRRRRERNLSWSAVSRETGLGPQAMHRMKRGYTPRLDSFVKLLEWMGESDRLTPWTKPERL